MSEYTEQLLALSGAVGDIIDAKRQSRYTATATHEAHAKQKGGAQHFSVEVAEVGNKARITVVIRHNNIVLLEDLYQTLDALTDVKELDLRRDEPRVVLDSRGITFSFLVGA